MHIQKYHDQHIGSGIIYSANIIVHPWLWKYPKWHKATKIGSQVFNFFWKIISYYLKITLIVFVLEIILIFGHSIFWHLNLRIQGGRAKTILAAQESIQLCLSNPFWTIALCPGSTKVTKRATVKDRREVTYWQSLHPPPSSLCCCHLQNILWWKIPPGTPGKVAGRVHSCQSKLCISWISFFFPSLLPLFCTAMGITTPRHLPFGVDKNLPNHQAAMDGKKENANRYDQWSQAATHTALQLLQDRGSPTLPFLPLTLS